MNTTEFALIPNTSDTLQQQILYVGQHGSRYEQV